MRNLSQLTFKYAAPTSEFRLITPPEAKRLLDSIDPQQRNIKPANVKKFETLIRRGEFNPTHQGIAISWSGTLLDGQHRLRAIVNTGIAVTMLVVINLPPEYMRDMDGGAPRSDADRMRQNPHTVAICSAIGRFNKPSYVVTTGVKQAVMAVIHDRVQELEAFAPTRTRHVTTAHIRAAVVLRMAYPNLKRHAMEQYRHMALAEYSSFCPQVGELYKQATRGIQGKLKIQPDEILCRTWLALDVERAESNTLLVRDYDALRRRLSDEIAHQIPALTLLEPAPLTP